jgi:glycosyltransferase involved in cell wall biosynthesis
MLDQLTIVVPSYNEAANLPRSIPPLIGFCEKNQCHLIVVDDGSQDQTPEILRQFPSPCLRVIRHKVNRGYGGAIKTGLEATRSEWVITVDADGQHQVEDIAGLFQAITEADADMAVGSRRKSRNREKFRRIGKWLIRKLAHILISKEIWDINSGMKIYRSELVKKYLSLCPDSMAFSDIITLVFLSQKHLVIEKDILTQNRTAGQSTIRIHTAFQTVFEILNIVMMFHPIKIFFPIAVLLFVAGFSWGLPIVIAGKGISTAASMLILLSIFTFLLGLIAEQLSLLLKKK